MYRACIAVVDASRARLFTLERTFEGGRLEESLIEEWDLINPARRQRTSQLFSDTRPGLTRGGSFQHATDDHRMQHLEQLDATFAGEIAEHLENNVRTRGCERAIVCASPNMLGQLRAITQQLACGGLSVDTVPRDLTKLTPTQLRDQLHRYGLLPDRPLRPGLAAAT